ncbi:FAD-dependent oxidoreductase [Niameybacter massiliensis]|uniref:FAD-dependent oxidoreductase n=1 Tax=Niameybacter massiliensis TaxID=1658108 RepID=UPI0006B561C1|nr:FAD-dependent oxidoreductase [Niameybacter massiliensis]
METNYDLIIVGGGPAGLSAAIYAGRAKLKTLIIEKDEWGGQVNKTYEVANYPGIRGGKGPHMMEEMRKQAQDFKVHFMHAEVIKTQLDSDMKVILTDKGELKAYALIIATGASPRKLGFKGEFEFTGRGVAYCSTCDGQLFEGLEVFVIGAGFAAAEEAIFLTKYAKKVMVIAREPEFTCAKSIADKVLAHPKVEVMFNTELTEVGGDELLNYAHFINNQTQERFMYKANETDGTFGVFVFVGYAPQSGLFKDVLETDEYGYLKTNEHMKTRISGVYVAGDLRPKQLRQIVTAVADGAIAATSAEKYISSLKEKLGIVTEEVEGNQVQVNGANHSNAIEKISKRRSQLLTDALCEQIKEILKRVEKQVTLITIVDEQNQKSIELRDLLLDLAELGEKIECKVYARGENSEVEQAIQADKYPIVALLNEKGQYSGVKFHGVPGGHELNSFILALYNLGGQGQAITSEQLEVIKTLDKPTNIKICVSLSCHLCPDVVVSAQRIAIENEYVEAEMIDLANFKAIKDEYKIMSVPAIIINDEKVYFGAKKLDEILSLLKD